MTVTQQKMWSKTADQACENSLSPYLVTRQWVTNTRRVNYSTKRHTHTHTHTHTRLTALFPGLPRWAGTRKVKPIWILLKLVTVSGTGISWAICKSAPCSRQTPTPAPHHCFLQARCPSCRPTNSVKALKALYTTKPQSLQHNTSQ